MAKELINDWTLMYTTWCEKLLLLIYCILFITNEIKMRSNIMSVTVLAILSLIKIFSYRQDIFSSQLRQYVHMTTVCNEIEV